MGVMYAYGSYNPIKQPVILNAFIIGIADFIFSILSGFIVWGALGYLQMKGDINYLQTNSVGLVFIAFPAASNNHTKGEMNASFTVFCLLLYVAGIDSAFSYIESVVCNILDYKYWNSMTMNPNLEGSPNHFSKRLIVTTLVCVLGVAMSALFTTNYGWALFDLVDHYTASYVFLMVGLMQCIAVGWLFEYDSTASCSAGHTRALKYLGYGFWAPVIIISFYANAGFHTAKSVGIIVIGVITLISWLISYKVSEMPFRSWYHEILFCGVDKLSMSITALSSGSDADGYRAFWMIPFEAWFGICIKFVNPAVFTFLIFDNMIDDLDNPFGDREEIWMTVVATIPLFISVFIIFIPMLSCDFPELFEHNVAHEFRADQEYSDALQGKKN